MRDVTKMYIAVLAAIVLLLLSVGFPLFVSAQEDSTDPGDPGDLCVVDQPLSAGFVPDSAFVLVQPGMGQVLRYPAKVVLMGDGANGEKSLLAGAAFPAPRYLSPKIEYLLTFFLSGAESKFAATTVRKLSQSDLEANAKSRRDLEEETERAFVELEDRRQKLAELEGELELLRREASKIAGVDDIIDLKMELESLEGSGRQKKAEVNRLRRLLEVARKVPEPPGIEQARHELSLQLKATAQATAMADRLNARRRQAAMASFRDKLRDVRESESVDVEELAREALRLRAKRRELENRLNVKAPERPTDF